MGDMVDESEVLTPADDQFHIDKWKFKIPFVCGARNLGEALRRISEGAAMIRTKGEAGTGNVVNAVHHARTINREIRLTQLGVDGCFVGSGIFKSNNPQKRAHAMVQAVTHFKDPKILAQISEDLGAPMVGINCDQIDVKWEKRESMLNTN